MVFPFYYDYCKTRENQPDGLFSNQKSTFGSVLAIFCYLPSVDGASFELWGELFNLSWESKGIWHPSTALRAYEKQNLRGLVALVRLGDGLIPLRIRVMGLAAGMHANRL